jgi:uncharacterized repeat protein (TIGR01451 family)
MTGERPPRPAHRGHSATRRLRLEPLESRNLLSATVLPSISGVAYHDLTGNGLTSDDPRLSGIVINLFKDGGDGKFEGQAGGDDQLVATASTDSGGNYRFDNLQPGLYFVQEAGAPGLVPASGQSVQQVTIGSSDTAGVANTSIDSFSSTTQYVSGSLHAGKTGGSATAASEALGGYRDLYVQLTSPVGSVSLGANADVPGALDFASGSASNGLYWVTWDGAGNTPQTLNPTGLGQIDLTGQGANTGISLSAGADHDNASALIKVYSDANDWSFASVSIPNTTDGTANQSLFVPWSAFTIGGGTGANFAKVGAVQLDVNGVNAVDGQIGPIAAAGPKVFSANFANVAQTDLAIVKTAAPGTAVPGNQLTYTLTTTNNGPSGGTGVTVSDPLPATVHYVSATSSQGSVAYSGGTLTASLGSLANGATATTTVIVTVDPAATGSITNTATVTGNETDPNLSNNTSTVTTPLAAQVDLGITKTAAPSTAVPGNQLTYTLTTTNHGPSNGTGVTVSDPLPATVHYVSATSSQGSVSYAGGTLTANLGSLANGATATTTVIVTVDPAATGSITNTATVTGNESDPNLSNNTSTVTTPIVPQVDLGITKSGQPNPITAGNQLTYSLTTTNHGPSNGTGATVTDVLPAGVQYVSAGGSGTASYSSGVVTLSLGSMAAGASVSSTILVTVNSATVGSITNTATVTGNEPDPNLANNKAQCTTTVDAPVKPQSTVDLSIRKTASAPSVAIGSNLTYTLLVTNNSLVSDPGVTVSDPLPAGGTLVSLATSIGSVADNGGVIQASLGTMTKQESATITIVVNVTGGAGSSIVNTATVTGSLTDSDPSNNQSTVTTPVTRPFSKWWFFGPAQ